VEFVGLDYEEHDPPFDALAEADRPQAHLLVLSRAYTYLP